MSGHELGHSEDCLICNGRCLLCGEPLFGHDEAACDEKMRNWQPRGILAMLDDDDALR